MIERCPICPGDYLPIPGDGPQPCPILLIAERPGQDENKNNRVFCGATGQELDRTYLPLASLSRSDVRVANCVLCWAANNRTPGDKEIFGCAGRFLRREIGETSPELIVLMGASACRLDSSIDLSRHHGRIRRGRIFDWSGWIIPMFHPSIGLHEGRWMQILLEDWAQIAKYVEGQRAPIITPPTYDFHIVQNREELDHAVSTCGEYGEWIATDTESYGKDDFSVQFAPVDASAPGDVCRSAGQKHNTKPVTARAYMVLARDRPLFIQAAHRLAHHSLILHNAVADLDLLESAAQLPVLAYRDTMQEAFHQGNLPQGLKELTYRLFDIESESWKEIVRPASIDALQQWLVEALLIAQADLQKDKLTAMGTCVCGHGKARHIPDCKSCSCCNFIPRVKQELVQGSTEALIRRLISHTAPTVEYDPWDRLYSWRDESAADYSHIAARIGPYPILGIGNCTLSRAKQYACGDAYWTGRVAVELGRRVNSGLFQIYSGDRDA